MMLTIRTIEEKEEWEKFLDECPEKTFLHSWSWGEFQRAMRENIWRFGFFEEETLFAIALVVRVKAKRGIFLLVPHGPVLREDILRNKEQKEKLLALLLESMKKIYILFIPLPYRVNP